MRINNTGFVLGATALAGAAVLLGAAIARATIAAPQTTPPAVAASAEGPRAEPASLPPGTWSASQSLGSAVLSLAAESAPFDPERRAPSERYLLPEDRIVEAPPAQRAPPPEPPFRVLGIVSGGPGGIAVVQAEGQAPKVLAVGEDMMGFRVSSIQEEVVVVSSQGWDLNLSVVEAQPIRIAPGANRNQRGNAQDRNARERAEQQERAANQARERLEQVARQMQQAGEGPVRVEMQGDRAILTGPDGVRRAIQIPGGTPGTTYTIVRPAAPARPGGGR